MLSAARYRPSASSRRPRIRATCARLASACTRNRPCGGRSVSATALSAWCSASSYRDSRSWIALNATWMFAARSESGSTFVNARRAGSTASNARPASNLLRAVASNSATLTGNLVVVVGLAHGPQVLERHLIVIVLVAENPEQLFFHGGQLHPGWPQTEGGLPPDDPGNPAAHRSGRASAGRARSGSRPVSPAVRPAPGRSPRPGPPWAGRSPRV